jgi:hypothetical protein
VRAGVARWLTPALAAVTASACAPSEVVLPEPPMTDETAQVISAYQSPTGTIDFAHIDMQLDRAEARLEELHLSWLPDLVADVLVSLEARLEDGELPTDPSRTPESADPRISAALTVHRVCKGWSSPPGAPDEAANGSIDLTAVVGGSALRRDLWGVATNCHSIVDPPGDTPPQMAFLDGTLIILLEGALPKRPGDANMVFLLNGRLDTSEVPTVANESRTASRDFRISDGQLEFRLSVDDGDIIVTVGATSFTLRGRNGTFTCDLKTHSCR